MAHGQTLYRGRLCSRCHLPGYGLREERDGWCLFCRCFGDEPPQPVGPVGIWRLRPDKTVSACTPGQLGTWDSTGRRTVALDLLELPGRIPATLVTSFLCVDYWAIGREPLLFETRLYEMSTGASYDRCTRRYATHPEASEGHTAEGARLMAAGAVFVL